MISSLLKSLLKATLFSFHAIARAGEFSGLASTRASTGGLSLRLPKSADTLARVALRAAAGTVFITLGYLKFFDSIHLGTDAVVIPSGPEGFAQYLAAIGVPFPLFNAYMVCWVEMICGLGLLLSSFLPASGHLTRLCALPLAGDMIVALATVGIPNLLGHPVMMEGVAVTTQSWRLPLEVIQLVIVMIFLWKPLPASSRLAVGRLSHAGPPAA
jgi:uncharacterized membrane protein YphA (DoxX/SURF4 family)